MATSYYNEERKRMVRFQLGFLRLTDMAKDLIKVKLSVKLGLAPEPPDFEQRWRDWCYEYHDFISSTLSKSRPNSLFYMFTHIRM